MEDCISFELQMFIVLYKKADLVYRPFGLLSPSKDEEREGCDAKYGLPTQSSMSPQTARV